MIEPVRLELLTQDIPFLFWLMKFHVILLRSTADAGQPHLLHQLCHIFWANLMTSLNKNSADLFSTQHLTILIKYFTDQSAIFLSAFLEPSIAPLISENISDDITVMYLGQMVEKAGSAEIFAHQYHPYTKALISAIPLPKYNAPDNQIILKGEITSPINVTKSCRFAPRCVYAKPECFENEPQLEEIEKDHFVKCHFVREINGL